MPEWERYEISGRGRPLSTFHHIVHLPQARRILEDGYLRSGLIRDESRLNRSRICVTWLSANTWGKGSVYGNVKFAFDWADIIEGRRVYWVEAIAHKGFDACRFLLTTRDRNQSKYVIRYDPEKHKGPLQKRRGKWYWNANCTSEFMLEGDIPLRKCISLSFVRHYPNFCRMDKFTCKYKDDTPQRTAGRVLAFILSSTINRSNRGLLREKQEETVRLNVEAENGVAGIWRALGSREKNFFGVIRKAKSRRAVLLGALALYGAEQDQAAKELVALLYSRDVFEEALVEIIRKKLCVPDYKLED